MVLNLTVRGMRVSSGSHCFDHVAHQGSENFGGGDVVLNLGT